MLKVCLIIPFYGDWPSYLNVYMKSCRFNEWLDVKFFTDIEIPGEFPENVQFIPFSLEEIRSLFNEKLGFQASINDAYKLCDLKPAYGFVFQDYIKDYEFWGFGDIDVILGKVNHFISPEITSFFDVICLRSEWCSGSLSLFRNKNEVNSLFMDDERYQEIFKDEQYCGFDECAKLFPEFRKKDFDLNQILKPNFTKILLKGMQAKKVKVHFKTLIKESLNPGEIVCWDKGRIRSNDVEYLLYHYITEKKKYSFFFPDWKDIPEKFFVDDTGFYTEKDLKRRRLIRLIRKVRGLYKFGLDIIPRAKRKYFENVS